MADVIDRLIEGNAQARAELMEALDALPAERRREGWFGDERWSLHQIVAHLIGWQIGWSHGLELMAKGERPSIPGYEGDDDAYNAQTTAERADRTWEQLMGELAETRQRHDAAVRGLRGNIDLDRIVEGRTAYTLSDAGHHDREHIAPILAWRREQGL